MAIDAAARASEKDTEDGSLRKEDAVFRAACFCAHVVPWPADVGASCWPSGEEVENFAKRDWSSPSCGVLGLAAGAGGGGAAACRLAGRGGDGLGAISKPGTDTPAAPNLFMAPWFNMPWCAGGSASKLYGGGAAGVCSSTCSVCLGGSRGGSEGFGFVCGGALGAIGGAGALLSAPSRLPGGGGRCAVESPVVSFRYGCGGGRSSSGSGSGCWAAGLAYALPPAGFVPGDALPAAPVLLGGGANEPGSLKEVIGMGV